jgi:hypothetical protein
VWNNIPAADGIVQSTKSPVIVEAVAGGIGEGGVTTVRTIKVVTTPAAACGHRVRYLFLQSTAAMALANVLVPVGAEAQTVLPDVNVIATTPLSGTRSPQRSVAPPAPARPVRTTNAPSTPGPATGTRTTATRSTAARTTAPTAPAAPAAPVPPPPPPIQGPAASGEISRDKVPSNTEVITSEAFSHDKSTSFLDTLSQSLPGVFISDQSGNQFQRDVNYRGFVASPVQGTPQGIAVYQNGVRINESYGDVVNWDFIPEMSISKLAMVPNNPIFGLNAIGGAMTIDMKNGFTYQGKEIEAMGGPTVAARPAPKSAIRTATGQLISTPTPSTTPGGATFRQPRSCAGSTPISEHATIPPRFTSTSPAPTTRWARRPRPRFRCSRNAIRASTRGRRAPICSSSSPPRA